MTGSRILLVDDDPDIIQILRDNLELDGYSVTVADKGKEALSAFEEMGADLVVLDLLLPDIDGIQVCRCIRQRSDAPILMLTARDRVSDKVLGLESGADDYLVKPFEYLELAARIRACLRRRDRFSVVDEILTFGDLSIDPNKKTVVKGDEPVDLTSTEFNLLCLLAKNPDKAMSRNDIRQALWPDGDLYKDSRAIDVHVRHLRAKLEDDPAAPTHIITVPGTGYMISDMQ